MERLINFDPQWINDVVITGINIFILFFAMSYLLFNPARDYLEKRRKKIAGDLETVSYTHLDVYKRQVQDLKALGFEVQTDRAGEAFGSNGFNVHAFLEGTIPGDPTIFCAHMDTVAPGNGIRPVIKDGIIGTDGSTILAVSYTHLP